MAELSVAALLKEAADAFSSAGIENPELEARLLLQHVLGVNRAGLILRWQEIPASTTQSQFTGLVQRRVQREPIAYITGEQEFWSLPFIVSPDVLIPRPETEFLLEQVLQTVPRGSVNHALDLGCGSGVIAVVLALELGCTVTTVDCSGAALELAARNARKHGVAARIHFQCGDFFSALPKDACFDLLVSNPPYIAAADIDFLQPEVRHYEPRLALNGGKDGLDAIATISRQAGRVLQPGSRLFVEIGADQAEAAARLFTDAAHHYDEVRILPDFSGRPRVLSARFMV